MLKNLFFLSFLLLSLSCQQGPKGSGESSSYVTYNESEFGKDYQNLQQAEQSLNAAGLKFKRVDSASTESASYVWDAESFKNGAAEASQKSALRGYVEIAELFLRKYSLPFFVNLSEEKTTLFRQIKENFRVELIGKLERAKTSLYSNQL